ncbi:hypothetical protein, partial [Escherichia coli]|uniref:hypothetical protein n=1 Tax=Escherichia coli TaxID=562 RepID=UPI001BDD66D6
MSNIPVRLEDVAGGFSIDGAGAPPQLPLFRPEALEAAAENGIGRPIALLPLSWGLLGTMLLAMIVTLGAFLFLGSYSRKE